MKNNKKKFDLPKFTAPVQPTHIRRCHICLAVTECDEHDVKACAQCGKSVAPFYFFSDTDVIPHTDREMRPERPPGKVRPILGFTAYW